MKGPAAEKYLFLDPADTDAVSEEIIPPADEAFAAIVDCLGAAGYDPVTQLTAYLIANDPTFLPEECEARIIAQRVGRDKLLEALLAHYMEHRHHD